MNITKKKLTQRYKEQINDYQWWEEGKKGQDRGKGWRVKTTKYKINKLPVYIVQHWEYSQYFIKTLSGV